MKTLATSLVLIGAACAARADNGGIGGPVTGFVLDGRTHAIRAIEGIPGAARLGAPVELPFAIASGVIASAQDFALVIPVSGDGLPVLARGFRSGSPVTATIESAIAPSGMAIADGGGAAVLYSNAAGKLQWITGLPNSPRAGAPIDISQAGIVTAIAVDAGGRNALLVGAGGNVYRATASDVAYLTAVAGASSASLLPSGDDAVVGSGQTGEVVLLRALSGSMTVTRIGGAFNGLQSVKAVRALNDHEIAVADATGAVFTIDADSGSAQPAVTAAAADRFEALDSNLLVLNAPGQHPLVLLERAQGHPTWFVPPDRAAGPHRK